MEIYNTYGTCSRQIFFEVTEDKTLTGVKFIGGCSGNLQALAKLVEGMHIDQVIEKLKGIKCRSNTSCSDQLATALIKYKQKHGL
ncbi:MAG: TIGR03905 family TSCPD domain-containing protein [Clostridia bacterium]|nr:TIGR03905 family TSCPD domain-containing protein [Clostridia bacterium]